MLKKIKMVVVAATVAASASSAFAATAHHRLMEGRYAATYAGDAATNQYTNREGLVDSAP
jgi:hypothetical protein